MKKPILAIEKLHTFMNVLIAYIPSLDDDYTQFKLQEAVKLDPELYKVLKQRHGAEHFKNFVNSMKKANATKAKLHSDKMMRAICYVADDYPPSKGQEVYVKRYEHGFFKYGEWSGKVKEVFGDEGQKKSYTVTVLKEYGKSCNFDVHISNTRDLSYQN